MKLVIDCSRPPSINALWRVGRGKIYRSRKYDSWIKEFGLCLIASKVRAGSVSSYFELEVTVSDKSRADLDNVAAKAILDALQKFEIIANDKHCRKLSAEYGDAPAGCRIVINSC